MDRLGTKLSQNFEGNRKLFLKQVKRARKGGQREVMRVKDSDGNMLVERKAVRHSWAEYFDKLLNILDGVQASFMAVGETGGFPCLAG